MEQAQPVGLRRSIVLLAPSQLSPARRNARTHTRKQIRQIANSIERFGFTNPILVDQDNSILAGHGRLAAAQLPVLCIADLSLADRKAYVLADNKLALNAGWDPDLLALELQELIDLDFKLDLTGFSLAEVDIILDGAEEASPAQRDSPLDKVPAREGAAVTLLGDVWLLGRHRLLCGDARSAEDYIQR